MKIIQQILTTKNFKKIVSLKKSIFPTRYDRKILESRRLQIEFYKSLIKPDYLCFDIGANYGSNTDAFLELSAKVISVEPLLDCIKELNLKYGKKATILQNGVGAANSTKDFYISNCSEISSFEKDWHSQEKFIDSKPKIEKIEKIEIITLDSMIEKYGNPDFIKIDVEGYELEVFKGLSKKVKCLSFEYSIPEKKDNLFEILNHLKIISPNAIVNYVKGREYNFALNEWIKIEAFEKYLIDPLFLSTSAGDIYIKN